MAIYHLHAEPASRSNGKSAVAMAAYRCGGRLIDDRTGEVKDYSRKQGIIQTTLFYPDGVEFDRQALWNMAESAEKRKDSRIAREIRVALPYELEPEARFKLVNDFSRDLVDRYGIAVDASIHDPDRQGDNRNYHAHLLLTTRQISQDGLGEKSDLERSDKALKLEGKISTIQQIKDIRSQWEELCNTALERQGREERISAKSYRARDIDQQPTIHIGPAATAMKRRGIQTRKVILNRAIRKQNQRRILIRRLGRVLREIELAEREIQELKREIERGERQVLQPELPHMEAKEIRIGEEPEQEIRQEIWPEATHIEPEKKLLTATDLLERYNQKTLNETKEELELPLYKRTYFKKFFTLTKEISRSRYCASFAALLQKRKAKPFGRSAALHFFAYAACVTRAAPGKFPSESVFLLNCLGDSHFSPLCGAYSL